MALTLNQVISRIRTLALSHYQINNFYFGDPWEFNANGEITYPACFLESIPGSINRTERTQTFNFRIYFLDLVGVSEGTEENETDVLSDMSSVAADMLAMLYNPDYQDDWEISEINPVTSITESINDLCAGVILEVGISVEFKSDLCQVPSSDVLFEEDFDMARTKILTYNGTGSEGSSFTVSGLAGKNVLAVYRAGNYKRAIVTTPSDSDKIKVTGTDLGSNNGIYSTDGTVALQTGDALLNGEVLDFIIWSN